MVLTTTGISAMKLDEVNTMLQELGWKPDAAGAKLTLLEKKSVLRELIEKNQDAGDQQNGYSNLAKKTNEQLKEICAELKIDLTGHETKPQLTIKIKKQLPPPEVPADNMMTDFGKYRGKTYEWIWSHDRSYCVWVTDTAIEEGDKCSRSLKKLAEYIENHRQQQGHTDEPGATAASASSPATLSARRDTCEDPETEIQKLQQRMDELKSQLSSRRRKTAVRDADMPSTED